MSKTQSIQLDFIFRFCDDIKAIYEFYTKVLGIEIKVYNIEQGWIQIDFSGVSLIFTTGSKVEKYKKFASQPGHMYGELEVTSYAIKYPQKQYQELWERIKAGKYQISPSQPEWRNDTYWSFSIMDPMGVSLELHFNPDKKPKKTTWE